MKSPRFQELAFIISAFCSPALALLEKEFDANRCESRYNCSVRGNLERIQVRSPVSSIRPT